MKPKQRRRFLLGVLTGVVLETLAILAYGVYADHVLLHQVVGFLSHQ